MRRLGLDELIEKLKEMQNRLKSLDVDTSDISVWVQAKDVTLHTVSEADLDEDGYPTIYLKKEY
jgi:hypothetical protein